MFLFQAEDRQIVREAVQSFSDQGQALITDAVVPGFAIPAVTSLQVTAEVSPLVGGGVEFADQTPHVVTVSVDFPTPTDVGLVFGQPQLTTPLATFDGFLLF
ncbi:hypothetical protein [Caulobacter sp. 17J65-9]|uniref:hypothetical protein n=1 Tax=Caulobacter sp. 17J65-9 TaxID=2709382 RepID=UPI0013CCB577|nr:hypothetical protein [Caulobacter sp. 17J65-9]NEX95338.1 hypothetical protein [Caulobacter sp. 17J65-9]